MNYIIKLISGDKITITEDEYKKLAGKTGLVFIPSLAETINMTSISRIYPENRDALTVDRSKQSEAVLSDGTRLIKQFGRWYCADGMRDDKGNLCVEPDAHYYPEMRLPVLPTPQEYEQKFKSLPVAEWGKLLSGAVDPERPQLDIGNRSGGFLEE
jgi:hypothetical protein